jgi:hypothetical protein
MQEILDPDLGEPLVADLPMMYGMDDEEHPQERLGIRCIGRLSPRS